jgi:hypothetical protein
MYLIIVTYKKINSNKLKTFTSNREFSVLARSDRSSIKVAPLKN